MQPSSQSSPQTDLPPQGAPGGGPAAHEDLTIGDHIAAMRVPQEQRPGESCFLRDSGERVWLPDPHVEEFLQHAGALHPNNYESRYNRDWTLDFLNPNSSPQSDHGKS